jgi:hypothetical protein
MCVKLIDRLNLLVICLLHAAHATIQQQPARLKETLTAAAAAMEQALPQVTHL